MIALVDYKAIAKGKNARVERKKLKDRYEELKQQWAFIDPILDAWRRGVPALASYPAGSWGPSEADTLIERDGRQWRRP